MDWLGTVIATFLAAAVEVVEVVTILLALGLTRGWGSTFAGAGVAAGALVLATAVLGTSLPRWIDVGSLQIVIGSLLLVFGLQWLRKAILRASGYKALHDEDAIFREESAAARRAPRTRLGALDWFAFTVACKGVFLEGLEIVFIVMTIGASSGQLPVAAASAVAAIVVVGAVGVVLHRPLSRVPENTIKFAVGLLLTTFGTFWAGEGVGVRWLGEDLALLWLLAVYAGASLLAVRSLQRQRAMSPLLG
jgi:uncharacterized membrane protein